MAHCYDDSLNFLLWGRHEKVLQTPIDDIKLVHGVAVISGGEHVGKEFGHAWIEFKVMGFIFCYDLTTDKILDRELFYSVGQVRHAVKYSKDEAKTLLFESNNYGPWDEVVSQALHAGDENGKRNNKNRKSQNNQNQKGSERCLG